MQWDGVQLTILMKEYLKLCNNQSNVTSGEAMRMHEEH
jgi:hypothetical protein